MALDPALRARYPFCRLSGNANVLVMPGLDSTHIVTHLVPRLGEAQIIGPILVGLQRPVQILSADATVNQIVNLACIAASTA